MKERVDTLPKLKEELTECYRAELRVLRDNPIMPRDKRAEFYDAEKEIVLKLLLLTSETETMQVANECWLQAKKDVPTHRAMYSSYRLPSQR